MKQILLSIPLCGLLFLCLACEKADVDAIDNLNNGRIEVIGHAGLGFESTINPYPSNTLTSIRKTVEGYGADGVEVDVQLSKDSVLVLYHDQELQTLTRCIGPIIDYTADQLVECSYRTDFNSHILQDEHVIKLEDVFARYAGRKENPRIYLDLKLPEQEGREDTLAYARLMARAVAKLVSKYRLEDRVVAESAEISVLRYLRRFDPDLPLMLDRNDFEAALQLALERQLDGLVINNDRITKEQVRHAHQQGLQVVLFNVILRKDIVDAVNKHPDVIQTDNVNLLQQILTK